jgi:hypothetical protein
MPKPAAALAQAMIYAAWARHSANDQPPCAARHEIVTGAGSWSRENCVGDSDRQP